VSSLVNWEQLCLVDIWGCWMLIHIIDAMNWYWYISLMQWIYIDTYHWCNELILIHITDAMNLYWYISLLLWIYIDTYHWCIELILIHIIDAMNWYWYRSLLLWIGTCIMYISLYVVYHPGPWRHESRQWYDNQVPQSWRRHDMQQSTHATPDWHSRHTCW